MFKFIAVTFFAIFFFCLVLLYMFGGLKEYVGFVRSNYALVDIDQRNELIETFYYGSSREFEGGVLAFTNRWGILFWGRYFLKFRPTSNETIYKAFNNCTADGFNRAMSGEVGDGIVELLSFQDFTDWKLSVPAGTHIYFYHDKSGKELVVANLDVKPNGPMPIFCKY